MMNFEYKTLGEKRIGEINIPASLFDFTEKD